MAKDASEEEDEVDQTGVKAQYRWDLHTHSVLTLSCCPFLPSLPPFAFHRDSPRERAGS